MGTVRTLSAQPRALCTNPYASIAWVQIERGANQKSRPELWLGFSLGLGHGVGWGDISLLPKIWVDK